MYDVLKKIMVDDLHLAEEDIRPEAEKGEAGFDSLALVELAMILSKRFAIEIGDEELAKLDTVADIAEFVKRRKEG